MTAVRPRASDRRSGAGDVILVTDLLAEASRGSCIRPVFSSGPLRIMPSEVGKHSQLESEAMKARETYHRS